MSITTQNSEAKSYHFLDEVVEETVNTANPTTNVDEIDKQKELEKAALEVEMAKEKITVETTDPEKELEPTEESEEFSYAPIFQELVDSSILPESEKEYEDSLDGFKEYIEDAKEALFKEYKEAIVDPVAQQFIDFLENGGSRDEFINKVTALPDYSTFDLSDEETAKNLIRDNLTIQEYDPKDIEELINEYSEIGSLEKHAKVAQKKLIDFADKEIKALAAEQKRIEAERVAKLEKEAEDLRASIYESESIAGFKLTNADKDKFYQYLTKPVKQDARGRIYTQSMLDTTEEDKIKMAFFKYKKFDFTDVENKAQSKAVQDIQKQLKKRPDNLSFRTTSQGEQKEEMAIKNMDVSWM
jgi:hypothetical protein